MSDETPPWEIPDSLLKSIAEAPARRQAEIDAVLNAPYVASEHMPVWDYIEDEDDAPTFLGCSCKMPTVYNPDDWGPHVDELQRRDRAVTWERGYMRAHSLDRGWDTHEAEVQDQTYLDADNPYRDQLDGSE